MRSFMLLLSVVMMFQNCNKTDEDSSPAGDDKVAGTGGDAGAEETDPSEAPVVDKPVCASQPFVSVWRIPPTGKTIHLPIVKRESGDLLKDGHEYDASFNITVDWGDDSNQESFSYDGKTKDPDFLVKHAYKATEETNDYEITIRGKIGVAWGYYFWEQTSEEHKESADSLVEVKDLGDVGWTSLKSAFSRFPELEKFAGDCISNVRSMNWMFGQSEKVTPNVSKWDTSNVIDMGWMFYQATSANPDVSKWDTSNVKDMGNMFDGATNANPDVSNWNTSNVEYMTAMFDDATSANPDVSKWDTSKVMNMVIMFEDATNANPDVSNWDFSLTYGVSWMFSPNNSLSTENYSTLLKKLAADPSAGGLSDDLTEDTLDVGTVKYNADAKSAREHLINEHEFEITDGGSSGL